MKKKRTIRTSCMGLIKCHKISKKKKNVLRLLYTTAARLWNEWITWFRLRSISIFLLLIYLPSCTLCLFRYLLAVYNKPLEYLTNHTPIHPSIHFHSANIWHLNCVFYSLSFHFVVRHLVFLFIRIKLEVWLLFWGHYKILLCYRQWITALKWMNEWMNEWKYLLNEWVAK